MNTDSVTMIQTTQNKVIRHITLIILSIVVLGLAGKAWAQDAVTPIDFKTAENGNGAGEPVATLDFEEDGAGADWSWATFENADNPALEIIDNPDASGINTSEKVAQFTARAEGQRWAGTRGTAPTKFIFNEEERTISIMVWKSEISDIGIKLETASNWSQGELKVANTKTEEWEEIVIDFSAFENPPEGEAFNGISVFPDFKGEGVDREQDEIVYFDNIAFNGFATVEDDANGETQVPELAAPTPTHDESDVVSVFSNAYTDVEGTNFDPRWGQATQVQIIDVDGSSVLRYSNFTFQGTELSPAIDASEMTGIRLDMWTADATAVSFTIISPGPEERLYALDITPGEWVTYHIPLSYFENVDLTDIIQMKFDGGNGSQTIYLDNIYFYDDTPTSITEVDDRPNAFNLAQNYPNPFNPSTRIAFSVPEAGHVRLDVFDMIGQRVATIVNEHVNAGSHTVSFDADRLSSGMYLYRLQSGSFSQTNKMMLVK